MKAQVKVQISTDQQIQGIQTENHIFKVTFSYISYKVRTDSEVLNSKESVRAKNKSGQRTG